MRRSLRSGFDWLEGKLLLTGLSTGLVGSVVATQTTSTGRRTSVALSFTETNRSNHAISVTYGPGNDGFTATVGSKREWVSNAGPLPQFLELKTLEPGQSITVSATWDGHSNAGSVAGSSAEGPALAGTVTISNQLDPDATTRLTIGEKPTHLVPPRAPAHSSK